jgi:inorganic triphosphatase YgiF
MPIERELKFCFPAQRSATELWRLCDAKPRRRRMVATYLDTAEGVLRRAHAALRLRRSGRRWLQCFKAERAGGPALLGRHEWELAARGGRLRIRAFPLDDIQASTGIELGSLEDRLQPIFTTEFERASIEQGLPGARIELALDRGTIHAGARGEPLREVEFELLEGEFLPLLEHVRTLIPALDLALEVPSKAERGYRLVAGERAHPIKARRPQTDAGGAARDATGSVIAACVAQIAANVRGAAASRDPEYLHQLRVGLRRLRSALRAFRDFAPPERTQSLVDSLRSVLPPLGAARDWDVVTDLLAQRVAPAAGEGIDFAPVLRRARRRRAKARREARAVAASSAFQLLLIDAMIWAEAAGRPGMSSDSAAAPAQPLGAFARHSVARLARKAEHAAGGGDWSDAAARHNLRIRLKRLRYVCEFFADCFKRKRVRRYLEHLEGLQDLLGELNDLATARRLIGDLDAAGAGVQSAFTRGWISAREDALIASLGEAWRALGKQTRPA